MSLGLHTGSLMYSNLVTDLRIARNAGYDAVEIIIPKLERYLAANHELLEVPPMLGPLQVTMLNSFLDIERQEPEARRAKLEQCVQLCQAANALSCSNIQVIPLNALRGLPWPEVREKIGLVLAELADIASLYGIRLALEPVSFASVNSLSKAMQILETADRKNVGLCIDTFHLWTGGTSLEEIANIDPALVVTVHIGDATPKKGNDWSDTDRDVLPGNGIIPLREMVAAICASGYDGLWSVELLGKYFWEWDLQDLACELKNRLIDLIT